MGTMVTGVSASPGRRLRGLLARPGALVLVGGGTPLEARCAEATGFESFYVSGYAIAAWRHGLPDIGLIALAEVADAVTAICAVTALPVVVDADTGYGDVASVAVAVRRLEQAGAAAIQLEDQVWPKRCGHMAGTEVIEAAEMARKVEAATASRRDDATVVIARTDARGPLGLDEAVARANLYARAGADLVFVDAPRSVDELRRLVADVDAPVVVNMTESGKTPILPVSELESMGFAVVLFPTAALRLAVSGIESLHRQICATGTSGPLTSEMATLAQVDERLGLASFRALEDGMGGS